MTGVTERLETWLRARTGLYRAVDPRYPSNLLAVTVAAVSGLALLILTGDLLTALLGAASSFSTWALGRELDPDRPRTANLAITSVTAGLGILAARAELPRGEVLALLLVSGGFMVMARGLIRSTGLAATATDIAAVGMFTLVTAFILGGVGWVLPGAYLLSLIVDRVEAVKSWLARGGAFLLGAAVILGAGLIWATQNRVLTLGAVLLGALNLALAARLPPQSQADNGTPLEPWRLVATTGLVWLGAAVLASGGQTTALLGLGAVGLWRLWFAAPRSS